MPGLPDAITVAAITPFVVGSTQVVKWASARISQVPTVRDLLALIFTLLVGPFWALLFYAIGIPGLDSWLAAFGTGILASILSGWGYNVYVLVKVELQKRGVIPPDQPVVEGPQP